jgi:hypothetical protein
MRVIDGSPAADHSTTDLPAEILLKDKNISTDVFNEYRKKGYKIFELGKYFIDENLSPAEYNQARTEIWKWFERNYLDIFATGEKVIFIFDVFNEKRRDSTAKYFGGQVIPEDRFTPPLVGPDFILTSDLETMREHVRALIASGERKNLSQ